MTIQGKLILFIIGGAAVAGVLAFAFLGGGSNEQPLPQPTLEESASVPSAESQVSEAQTDFDAVVDELISEASEDEAEVAQSDAEASAAFNFDEQVISDFGQTYDEGEF